MVSRDYEEALRRISVELGEAKRAEFKIELLGHQFEIHEELEDVSACERCAHELIAIDPNNPAYFVNLGKLPLEQSRRRSYLDRALAIDPQSRRAHYAKAGFLVEQLAVTFGAERTKLLDEIQLAYRRCLMAWPTLENSAWSGLIDFYLEHSNLSATDNEAKALELIDGMKEQYASHLQVLSAELDVLSKFHKDDETLCEAFVNRVASIVNTRSVSRKHRYQIFELNVSRRLRREDRLKRLFLELDDDAEFVEDALFHREKALANERILDCPHVAAEEFTKAFQIKHDSKDFYRAVKNWINVEDIRRAEELISESSKYLKKQDVSCARREILEATGKYDVALAGC